MPAMSTEEHLPDATATTTHSATGVSSATSNHVHSTAENGKPRDKDRDHLSNEASRFFDTDGYISFEGLMTLAKISVSGMFFLPWIQLRKLVLSRTHQVIESFREQAAPEQYAQEEQNRASYIEGVEYIERRIMQALRERRGAPFTIQRLCEVLIEPRRQYRSYRKLLSCLDKLTSVSAEVSPVPPSQRTIGSNAISEEKIRKNLRLNSEDTPSASPSRNPKRTIESGNAEENSNGVAACKHSRVDTEAAEGD
eukprot:gb/GECG01005690.1/.p1 GENE.gb/GECG01005690.1/~~gb/GECG01005690.1/.p1  ORF type:complete len:253 (+),score=33.28 gb/GECG01005690.1/:1-759(+)